MKNGSAFIRAFAALALVLAMVAGLFSPSSSSAQVAVPNLPSTGTVGTTVSGNVAVTLDGVPVPLTSATAGLFADATCAGASLLDVTAQVDAVNGGVFVSLTPDTPGPFFIGVTATTTLGVEVTVCTPITIAGVDVPLDPILTPFLPGTGTVGVPTSGSVDVTLDGVDVPLASATAGLFTDDTCTTSTGLDVTAQVDAVNGGVFVSLTPDTAGDFFLGVTTTTIGGVTLTTCVPITIAGVLPPAGGNVPTTAPLVIVKIDAETGDLLDGACFTAGTIVPNANVDADVLGLVAPLLANITLGDLGCTVDGEVVVANPVGDLLLGLNALAPALALVGTTPEEVAGNIELTVTLNESTAPDGFELPVNGTVTAVINLGALLGGEGITIENTPVASASSSASDNGNGSGSASASSSASSSASDNGNGSASSSASASASASPSFEGDVVEDAVVITGAIQEDPERDGEYDYFYNFVAADETNDIRLAGEGEQEYFVAFFDENNDLVNVDSGFTDANGMVTLNAPADEDYFIYEADDFNDPFGSQTLPAGAQSNFFVVEYVSDITASPSASASGSADSSARGSSNQPGGPTASGSGTASNGGSASNGGNTSGGAKAPSAGTGGGSATSLPNTGAGSSEMGGSMTWALVALMAIVGVAAAGFGLRRRNV